MTTLTHKGIVEGGRYADLTLEGADRDTVLELHRFMLRLRRCEERLIEEYHPADEMKCPVHFCIGQEATPAALATQLRDSDILFSHHRSHGFFLAKGAPMRALFAELYGRTTGANGGLAGSQDISMPENQFYAGAILAGAISIAAGAALAQQLRGTNDVVVSGFGEGATDEGVFWETVNYAALRNLPVVFACENNRFATFSSQDKRRSADNLSERVRTFGVHTETLFGNDVVKVQKAYAEAFDRARNGGGPTFIEAYTYRWNGHVGPVSDDHQDYRPEAERAYWRDNCPIQLLEEKLFEAGWLTDDARAATLGEIEAEIEDCFEFAKSSPFPESVDWAATNYASETPVADELLVEIESGDFNQDQQLAVPGPY